MEGDREVAKCVKPDSSRVRRDHPDTGEECGE